MRRLFSFLRRVFGRERRTPRLLDELRAEAAEAGEWAGERNVRFSVVDDRGRCRRYVFRDGRLVELPPGAEGDPPPDKPA